MGALNLRIGVATKRGHLDCEPAWRPCGATIAVIGVHASAADKSRNIGGAYALNARP